MVDEPAKHFAAVAAAGGDSVTFHIEAVDDVRATIRAAREQGLQVGIAFNPETEPEARRCEFADAVDLVLCMSIHPGYSGQQFQAEAYERVAPAARERCPTRSLIQVDGGVKDHNVKRLYDEGATAARRRVGDLRSRGSAARVPPARAAARSEHRARARARRRGGGRAGTRSRPSAPSSSRDGEIVGEGVTEPGGRHAEVVALAAAGERARGATLYVTLEPCAHHGTTPPCTDAIVAAGVERVVFGARDPNPEAAGGEAQLRAAGVDVEFVDWFEARVAERGVAHVGVAAAAVRDLQGGDDARRARDRARAALGDRRGEPPTRARAARCRRRRRRRRRHGARRPAAARRARRRDAEGPAAAARLHAAASPRRHGLEARRGPLAEELAALAAEGVQSLLLEGGPTLAAAFLAEDLVDKVLVFVAPTLSGDGPVGRSLRYPPRARCRT